MIILSSFKKIFLELLDTPWRRDGQLLSEVQYVLKVYLAEFGRLWAPFLLKVYCTYNVFRLCIAHRDYSKKPVTNSKALCCWLTNSLKQQQSYFFPDQHGRGLLHMVCFFTSPFAIGEQAFQVKQMWTPRTLRHVYTHACLCVFIPQLPLLQVRLILIESICHQLKHAYGQFHGTANAQQFAVSKLCLSHVLISGIVSFRLILICFLLRWISWVEMLFSKDASTETLIYSLQAVCIHISS